MTTIQTTIQTRKARETKPLAAAEPQGDKQYLYCIVDTSTEFVSSPGEGFVGESTTHEVPQDADPQARQQFLGNDGGQAGSNVGLPVGAVEPSTKKTPGNQTQLQTFLIAGADRKFVPAEASIDGDSVLVWSDKVTAPAAVRYAWLCNPEGCNLYSKEGLPASPFRTDDWPWMTGKR